MSAAPPHFTAFEGTRRIAVGPLVDVALALKEATSRPGRGSLLAFENATGRVVDLDLRGTPDEIVARYTPGSPTPCRRDDPSAVREPRSRGRGRPRLGVVSREVTLLPRHWAWLSAQRGGASATLRRLVDQARKAGDGPERVRRAQDAAYRFMSAMAGDLPGYEEAIRALFAGNAEGFDRHTSGWAVDVRAYARTLAADALDAATPATTTGGKG